VSETSQAALYGRGVFTTIRIIDGEPFLWEKHWRRLEHDAERLGIDLSPYSEYMIRRGLDESIPDDQRSILQKARISFMDERPAPLWTSSQPPVPTSVSILLAPLGEVPRPFRIGISSHRINSTSPIAGLKTCNYLEQTMSLDAARSRGFNEAIRLNEHGHITSACVANVFWLIRDQLFTPALLTGCLRGTTREFVLENIDCKEVEAEVDVLERADAIFLTSVGLGVIAADEFNGRRLAAGDHSILRLI
jgi:branched-subunit amino acid aminotransferase/4-amino-4-deoxychorismate lyase